MGISIDDAVITPIPPRQVKRPSRTSKPLARTGGKTINQAEAYANTTRNEAEGEAKAIVNAGKSDAERLIRGLAADASYFRDQLPNYQRNPHLFLARLQTETLQRILTNAQEKILRMDNGERKMWLQLNREPLKPAIAATTTATAPFRR